MQGFTLTAITAVEKATRRKIILTQHEILTKVMMYAFRERQRHSYYARFDTHSYLRCNEMHLKTRLDIKC